jgi:hypothetical protein
LGLVQNFILSHGLVKTSHILAVASVDAVEGVRSEFFDFIPNENTNLSQKHFPCLSFTDVLPHVFEYFLCGNKGYKAVSTHRQSFGNQVLIDDGCFPHFEFSPSIVSFSLMLPMIQF